MSDLHLGRLPDSTDRLELDPSRLRTHGVVVGMTGSGKTGLCLVMLEELVRAGVPILALDPKGDLGNLGLVFPELRSADFQPWAGEQDADAIATRWRSGLEREGLVPDGIQGLRDKLDLTVYTPGSEAGVPINLLGSLRCPAATGDDEAARELVADTVSGLLGLVGRAPDPVRDPAHVVLSHIVQTAWSAGEDLDLETLIMRLVDPPFEKVGVFPVDRFFPPDDRMDLAMRFNAVVASPTFSAWTKGATLDIGSMVERGDKTKVHVFSLAHLDESERQFFVSLLAGQLLAWSRSQPGTDDLRALLFFDEVAGFLPPHPKQPPSKRPLLTIMKQSRAVGLGVVLSTQNPVDLDYKALSNAGTWCIGRLNTAQDRERLLSGIDGSGLDAAVAGLEKRQFLLHQVGRGAPAVFGTRHAMCFLRGPLTRVEVGKVNALFDVEAPAAPAEVKEAAAPQARTAAPAIEDVDRWYLDPRVVFAARMEGVFEEHAEPKRDDDKVRFAPALYASLSLRFDEDRVGFVVDEDVHRVWFPLGSRLPSEATAVRLEAEDLLDEAPEGAVFDDLPGWMDESKELKALQKQIVDDVYRSETRGMFVNKALKLYGKAGESREDFEARCREAVEAAIDQKVEKLRDKYASKSKRIEDRIESKQAQLVDAKGVEQSRQLDEVVNIGMSIMSLFGGRKAGVSKAITKRRQSARAANKSDRLEDEIEGLQEDAAELVLELDEKISEIRDAEEKDLDETEEREVRMEKSDIRVNAFGVLWVPVSRRI